jgi:DNA-directed RNA polymerase subunit RPC12/RpoP
MFMNATCPMCGHRWRVPERMLGQQIPCPACSRLFQCGSVSPPSLSARPVAAQKSPGVEEVPQTRAVQTQPGQSIHYRCARCGKSLESPAHLAGQKVNCPDCGQRLQIPHSSSTPSAADNKTILASADAPCAAVVPVSPAPSAPRPPAEQEPILSVIPLSSPPAPARREYCLECGVDITQRPRVQTCPDCGSLFCSARCYRDHCHHAHRR